MNSFKKTIIFCLAVLFSVGLYGTAISGVKGPSKKPGEPPKGVAHQDDAKGIKLYGVIFAEAYDYYAADDEAGGVRFVIRLRKGNILHTFFKHVQGPLYNFIADPGPIQEIIQNEIAPDILNFFFPGEEVSLTVKSLENWDDVQANSIIIRDDPNDVGIVDDCSGVQKQLETHENCVNWIDDDNDGYIDVLDQPDCGKISFIIVADIDIAVK